MPEGFKRRRRRLARRAAYSTIANEKNEHDWKHRRKVIPRIEESLLLYILDVKSFVSGRNVGCLPDTVREQTCPRRGIISFNIFRIFIWYIRIYWPSFFVRALFSRLLRRKYISHSIDSLLVGCTENNIQLRIFTVIIIKGCQFYFRFDFILSVQVNF